MTHFGSFLFPVFAGETSPLALRPLLIIGMSQPVIDGDGGINLKTYTDYEQGLLCAVNAYAPPMLAGDTLDIYLDTEKVCTRVLQPEEENSDQPVFFYLPVTSITPGWIEKVYYILTRRGDPIPEDPSTALRVLVKLDLPGDRDKDPHLPGHSELHIVQLPQDVIDNGVDVEWAARGVPMTIPVYVNIAEHDVVQVQWGTAFLAPHEVTVEQAAGTVPIVITATQDDILAGGDSNALRVHYEIHDQVWNYSETWSLRTTVKVEAGAWRLEAPIIQESQNDIIDLSRLNNQPVTVMIRVDGADFALGDTITMTWIGTPYTGKPSINVQSKPVDSIPQFLEMKIPYDEVRAIAMGSADVAYVLTKKNGDPPLSSKRTFADVIGQVLLIPAPTIREVLGDTLEPDVMYATVDIQYPGMANGDVLDLAWRGTQANGNPYLHVEQHFVSENEAAAKRVTLYVEGRHIRVLENGRLDLFYQVSNDKPWLYGVSESEHLLVKVEAVRATLPAPKVVEADDDVLDPSKVFDNVHVRIEYLGTVKDDILTYYWTSPNPFASTGDWVPITTVSAGKPVQFRVAASYVSANIGQYVKVRYTLKHAATGLFSYSATLNLMIGYLVGDLPHPVVTQAEDDSPNTTLNPMKALAGVDINAGYASMDPLLDIIGLKWLGTPGPGTSEDLELPGDASKTVQFHLPSSLVGANINKMVSVSYDVQRYGASTSSEIQGVRVLAFQDPENELPRPQVPQSSSGVLDLMLFSGNANVTVQKWPFIALKQRVWLRLEGKTTTGATYIIVLLAGVEVTAAHVTNGLDENLLRSELIKLGHSTPATVVCKVTFDGDPLESNAIEFPLLSLTIRTRYDYVTPLITQALDSRGEVAEGGVTRDKNITIKGTATRGETIELFDNLSQSMGTAPVDADSTWSREIGTLTEKPYSITAKALYDADPVSSDPRTFTVKFTITPTLDRVTDSRGPVARGGTTYDNSVLVEGEATPNERVQLLDGATPIIEVDVDNDGLWEHRYNSLTPKAYTLSAKALYVVDPIASPPYAFNVAQAITPTISTVTDIRGNVANGGTTYYRSVELGGTASKNEKIELRDGSTVLSTVDVDANGNWKWPFNNLTTRPYSLTAKALYGAQPVSAPPRTFTVAAQIPPTLTSVTDAAGNVPHNGTTYYRSVTLSGEATPRERVQIYEGSNPTGSPVTVDNNKRWTFAYSGLSPRSYSMTARALYEVSPITSQARGFRVAEHIGPTLDSLKAGGVEVENGRDTTATSFTLQGQVTANLEVQIRDNGGFHHSVRANGTTWNSTLNLAQGSHRITAYSSVTGQESVSRSFTIVSPIPPVTINPGHVSLSAWIFRSDYTPTNPPAGAFVDRSASGGVPPYRYTSSNPAVAEVNASTGRVISKGNGSVSISVFDSRNQTASYSVSVSNVWRIFGTGAFNTYTQCHNAAVNQGGRIPSLAEWNSYRNIYAGVETERAWCWASDQAGFGKRWAIYPATGQTQALRDIGIGGDTANGYGIRNG
ncbi:hypothetical protein SAMN04487857_104333 [Pseudomonas sp. ok272]|uniref:hypothetical protein n=1 Tax=unclassified Pseudomonas TaxID=196821 RepID=UPI0008CA5799|nr:MULTISPECIES: hypothetical protein [unclassified Pseudomonas]SEM74259.1 hypothetical protein SAMN04487857_104333 [Pseudomonas sp. ok272]SFM63003.1 hypothetical protein SAMN04487858_104333 [Pseudomonas sp. ok602]